MPNRFFGVSELLVIILLVLLMFALAWIRALLEERSKRP